MEVIAVATTVCSLCTSIATWIEQQGEKHDLLRQISSTVDQIHNILHPFSSSEFAGIGELQLSQSIRSVGDVLQRTKEHLYVWKSSRTQKILSFLKPTSVIQKLKDDQQQINHQLFILLTAIATVGYFWDRGNKELKLIDSERTSRSGVSNQSPDRLEQPLIHQDACDFWRDFIGAKIEFVESDQFASRLSMWYKTSTPRQTFDRIIMRLDEYNSGGVTPYNLARALQNKSLRDFIDEYVREDNRPTLRPPVIRVVTPALRLPLLIWIDDEVENVSYEIGRAQEMGICVIHLSSTAIAKAWIEENYDFLKENDGGSNIRVISDNVRLESGVDTGPYLNPFAGQNILRFMRGRLLKAPVLIFTGLSIRSTVYVTGYTTAGSTMDARVCLQYITKLASRVDDDKEWRGFDRVCTWN